MVLLSSALHCQRHYGRTLSRRLWVSYKLQDHVHSSQNLGRHLSHCCAPSQVLQRKVSGQHIQVITRRHESLFLTDILVDGVEEYFQFLHGSLGLEWWAAIAITVIPLRLLISAAIARKSNEKMTAYREITERGLASKDGIKALLKQDRRRLHLMGIKTEEQLEKLARRKAIKYMRDKYKEHGCSSGSILSLMFIPLPFWITITAALRRMSGGLLLRIFEPGPIEESLSTGGCLWFQDLLLVDPLHILPFTAALAFLMSLEVTSALTGQDKLAQQFQFLQVTPILARIFIIFFPIMTWNLPSAILFYWNISAFTALAFTLGAVHPSIRILLLKVDKHPSAHPYRDLVVLLKLRYKNMWRQITTLGGRIG